MTEQERNERLDNILLTHQERLARLDAISAENVEQIRDNKERLIRFEEFAKEQSLSHERDIAEMKAMQKAVAVAVDVFKEFAIRVDERLDELKISIAHTDQRLDALIDFVETRLPPLA